MALAVTVPDVLEMIKGEQLDLTIDFSGVIGSTDSLFLSLDDSETVGTIQTLFRSLGTDAMGTLNAWVQSVGSWAIASNIVTQTGNNGALMAGHADWGDCTFTQRFKWVTGGFPRVLIHSDPLGQQSVIVGSADGAGIGIDKWINPTYTTLSSAVAALTNGNFYWFKLQASATTYTLTVYNDSVGAIGTQIASCSSIITDSVLQSGQIGIGSRNATQVTFGGAFANVCQVTGLLPSGRSIDVSWTGKEPSFCWSSVSPYAGLKSMSISVGGTQSAGGVSLDSPSGVSATPVSPLTSYTLTGRAKSPSAGLGSLVVFEYNAGGGFVGSTTIATTVSGTGWQFLSGAVTTQATTAYLSTACQSTATTGTVYFDNIGISKPSITVLNAESNETVPSAVIGTPTIMGRVLSLTLSSSNLRRGSSYIVSFTCPIYGTTNILSKIVTIYLTVRVMY